MRFAAGNGPVAVKRRAVNSSIALKMSLYYRLLGKLPVGPWFHMAQLDDNRPSYYFSVARLHDRTEARGNYNHLMEFG
jgi:hypothetical protein